MEQLWFLASLAEGPKHGYAITQDVEEVAGVKLGPGTLYGALSRLEGRELIEALPSEDRRRPYKITAAGSAALAAALASEVSALASLVAALDAEVAALASEVAAAFWLVRAAASEASALFSLTRAAAAEAAALEA